MHILNRMRATHTWIHFMLTRLKNTCFVRLCLNDSAYNEHEEENRCECVGGTTCANIDTHDCLHATTDGGVATKARGLERTGVLADELGASIPSMRRDSGNAE